MSKLYGVYGVYSAKQALRVTTVFYSSPDGGEVEVTDVATRRGCPFNLFDDKVDCGEVVEYLRQGHRGVMARKDTRT